jgi:hypothetical protein
MAEIRDQMYAQESVSPSLLPSDPQFLRFMVIVISVQRWTRLSYTYHRQQAAGNRQQATGSRQQATGNRQQATGNRQQATYSDWRRRLKNKKGEEIGGRKKKENKYKTQDIGQWIRREWSVNQSVYLCSWTE